MTFRGEEYFRAGMERMRQARFLYGQEDSYSLAIYCGGVAVECMLRAFRWNKDRTFEGRHDLEDLLRTSSFLRIHDEHLRLRGFDPEEIAQYSRRLRAAMSEVTILWHNNLRYASESSLRAFLNRIGRLHGIKGNALKKNALDFLNAAQLVVDRGVALWTSKKR